MHGTGNLAGGGLGGFGKENPVPQLWSIIGRFGWTIDGFQTGFSLVPFSFT